MASHAQRHAYGERSLPPVPSPPPYPDDNDRASTSQSHMPALRRTPGVIRSSLDKPRLSLSPVPGGMPGVDYDGSDSDSWSEVHPHEARTEVGRGRELWPIRPHGPRPNPSPHPPSQPEDAAILPGAVIDSPDTITPGGSLHNNPESNPDLHPPAASPLQHSLAPFPLTIAPDSPDAPILLANGNTKLIFRVRNPNDTTVAIKVMTTQPKIYSVRPNYGIIGPGEVLDLEVHAPPDVNRRRVAGQGYDRFAVLSTFLREGESSDREDISPLFPRKTAGAPNICTQKFRIRPLPVPPSSVRSPRSVTRPLSPFAQETIGSLGSPTFTAQGLPPTSILNTSHDVAENGFSRARSPVIRFMDNPALPSLTTAALSLQQQPSEILSGLTLPLERTISEIQGSVAHLEALTESLKAELALERSRIHKDWDDEPATLEYVRPAYMPPDREGGAVRPSRVFLMAATIFLGTYFGRAQGLL